jgi:hypothetical protein
MGLPLRWAPLAAPGRNLVVVIDGLLEGAAGSPVLEPLTHISLTQG